MTPAMTDNPDLSEGEIVDDSPVQNVMPLSPLVQNFFSARRGEMRRRYHHSNHYSVRHSATRFRHRDYEDDDDDEEELMRKRRFSDERDRRSTSDRRRSTHVDSSYGDSHTLAAECELTVSKKRRINESLNAPPPPPPQSLPLRVPLATPQSLTGTPCSPTCSASGNLVGGSNIARNRVAAVEAWFQRRLTSTRRAGADDEFGRRNISSFTVQHKIGEGTYGQVYKAVDKKHDRPVALKRIRLDHDGEGFPINTIREIQILRQVKHKNIVNLLNIVTNQKQEKDEPVIDPQNLPRCYFLVFEYCSHDLFGILHSGLVRFTETQVGSFMKQILSAVDHCHSKGFLHRDLKCSNILVTRAGRVKIADFGLARSYAVDHTRPYTNRVVTLWYRAPELLLGLECYGPPIDVWSCGCIMGEMLKRKPVFRANSEHEQLEAISKLCGTPCLSNWPRLYELPYAKNISQTNLYPRSLRHEFGNVGRFAFSLLDQLLTLDPNNRVTVRDALTSPFIKAINIADVRPPTMPQDYECHELWSKKKRQDDIDAAKKKQQQQRL